MFSSCGSELSITEPDSEISYAYKKNMYSNSNCFFIEAKGRRSMPNWRHIGEGE